MLKDVYVTAERIIEKGKESWIATSETLPGLFIQGDSYEDLGRNLVENVPLLVHEMHLITSNKGLIIHLKVAEQFKIAV